jgi:hypothetical protein
MKWTKPASFWAIKHGHALSAPIHTAEATGIHPADIGFGELVTTEGIG